MKLNSFSNAEQIYIVNSKKWFANCMQGYNYNYSKYVRPTHNSNDKVYRDSYLPDG